MIDSAGPASHSSGRGALVASLLGGGLLLAAVLGGLASVGSLADLPVNVRPAAPDEAPSPATAADTVVGQATGETLVASLRRTGTMVVVLALVAVLGGVLLAWGLTSRRRPAGDAPAQAGGAEAPDAPQRR